MTLTTTMNDNTNDFKIDIHDVVDNVDSGVDWMEALRCAARSSAGGMSETLTHTHTHAYVLVL